MYCTLLIPPPPPPPQLKTKKDHERKAFAWAMGVARRRGEALDNGRV